MRIAHIIIAHKNPAQLERLLKAMYHPDFDFYIHIDKKSDIGPFEYLAAMPQVNFIKERIVCNWGGFSLVETAIRSIDEILKTDIKYDFINLLSAQDYPLKSTEEIHSFFSTRLGQSFISFDSSNDTLWWREAEQRYKRYHFTDIRFKGKYTVEKIVNKILPERKLPPAIGHLYGGNRSCWWTLSLECAAYVSDYLKKDQSLVRFLKLTWAADEFIIPTLLMNSPLRDKITAENYRYMDWSSGQAHPKILTVTDYQNLTTSKMLFARKFDDSIDTEILDKLEIIISKSA